MSGRREGPSSVAGSWSGASAWIITGLQEGRGRLGGEGKGWRRRHRAANKHIIDFLSNGETLVLLGCNGSIH